jgi:hypothetical protein
LGQGFINSPEVVKKCLLSWKIKNPTWKIIELDDSNLNEYINIHKTIPNLREDLISKTGFSDIVRIFLLKKYGGLWCDATTICIKSLDSWLPKYIKSGFFAFRLDAPDRILSSWFLYSDENNYIVHKWYDAVVNFVTNNMNIIETNNIFELHYFWFHYRFGELYDNDDNFKKIWDDTKKMSADGPLCINKTKKFDTIIKNKIDAKMYPLFKLSYKYNNLIYNSILNYIYNLYKIEFIHIGKCAGTTIVNTFKLNEIHLKKPIFSNDTYYVIWLRNPIDRFVSAFYFVYHILNLDTSNVNINDLSLDNSIAPLRTVYKMKNNHTYTIEYDELVNFFGTPNNLAESITSNDITIREKAHKLMTYDIEHIFRGIGWYLDNGDFVKKYHKNILFVGKLETINEDTKKLSKLLNIRLPDKLKKIRDNSSNNYDRSLSNKAIFNIIEFYKNTDYKALDTLQKYEFINEDVINEYHKYQNVV